MSVRRDLWHNDDAKLKLAFAYTAKSFWQIYATSAPFRTVDHEPELFGEWHLEADNGDRIDYGKIRAGLAHQSNGEGQANSRSWDRVYIEYVFSSDHFIGIPTGGGEWLWSLKPWWAFNLGSQNQDLRNYMGNAELAVYYNTPSDYFRFGLRYRNSITNKADTARTSLLFSASFGRPDWNGLRIYAQYFNGYGESLLDYNDNSQRIGVGVEFAPHRLLAPE